MKKMVVVMIRRRTIRMSLDVIVVVVVQLH